MGLLMPQCLQAQSRARGSNGHQDGEQHVRADAPIAAEVHNLHSLGRWRHLLFWRRLCASSVCRILGSRCSTSLLRSVVKSDGLDQTNVDRVIL